MDGFDEDSNATWNMDAAQAFTLFEIKLDSAKSLDAWDLEKTYWNLRRFRRELDAILKRKVVKRISNDIEEDNEKEKETETEKKVIDDLQDKASTERTSFNQISSPSEKEKTDYFAILEDYYMQLCLMMKKHGIYYREGSQSPFAIGRR